MSGLRASSRFQLRPPIASSRKTSARPGDAMFGRACSYCGRRPASDSAPRMRTAESAETRLQQLHKLGATRTLQHLTSPFLVFASCNSLVPVSFCVSPSSAADARRASRTLKGKDALLVDIFDLLIDGSRDLQVLSFGAARLRPSSISISKDLFTRRKYLPFLSCLCPDRPFAHRYAPCMNGFETFLGASDRAGSTRYHVCWVASEQISRCQKTRTSALDLLRPRKLRHMLTLFACVEPNDVLATPGRYAPCDLQ